MYTLATLPCMYSTHTGRSEYIPKEPERKTTTERQINSPGEIEGSVQRHICTWDVEEGGGDRGRED